MVGEEVGGTQDCPPVLGMGFSSLCDIVQKSGAPTFPLHCLTIAVTHGFLFTVTHSLCFEHFLPHMWQAHQPM